MHSVLFLPAVIDTLRVRLPLFLPPTRAVSGFRFGLEGHRPDDLIRNHDVANPAAAAVRVTAGVEVRINGINKAEKLSSQIVKTKLVQAARASQCHSAARWLSAAITAAVRLSK